MKVFGKVQKKKERKLNHSTRICVQALLQRWPTPCVHISTRSLIIRSCWQCHVLPAAMSKTASRTGARVLLPIPVLWRSESQLHAWKRLQDPGTFFPNLLRALRWKRPLVVCWTVARRTCASKNIGKERGSPQVKSMLNALGKVDRCLVGVVLFARLECLRRNAPDPSRQRQGPRPPNRHVCECKPCVILALRSWNEVEVSIKHRVYGVRVLCLFLLLFLLSFFLFFFIFTFFRNGQGQPPLPQTGMPVFW